MLGDGLVMSSYEDKDPIKRAHGGWCAALAKPYWIRWLTLTTTRHVVNYGALQ